MATRKQATKTAKRPRKNPADHKLYQAAQKADDAWQAELKRVFGARANDARYDKRGSSTPKLKKLKAAFDRTSAAMRKSWENPAKRRRNTTIIKARQIGKVIIRKKPSVANPYLYQIQFQQPGGTVQHAGAYYTSSRTDALKQAETDLKRRKLWKPKTKLITGAVPLNSVAAKHKNPRSTKASKKVRTIREKFTGLKSRKTSVMNAPRGTPANLAKLGRLVSIKAEKGTLRPARRNPAQIVWLCADSRGKLHLCTTGDRLIDGPAQSFGQIKEIEYEAIKPHLGHKRPTIFFHEMGEEGGKRPELRADGAGGLKIQGGTYYVTPEGIRD